MFCFRCGADIDENDRVCPNCRAPLGGQPDIFRKSLPASFARRLAAFCLDTVILLLIFSFVSSFMRVLAVYVFPLMVLGYFVLGWLGERQATMGMSLQSLKITDARTGGRIGAGAAIARSLLMFLSIGLAFIGCIVMLFNKSGQMLHDLLTGTAVIYEERGQ